MFCVRFWVVPGRFSMMSVGLGGGVRLCGWRWSIREGHEFSLRKMRCRTQAGRLALVGPVATACRGARREGQLRIELCYCRGVTGRERRCQDAGKSAVTFLLGAAQFQNLRLCGYRAFWNRVAIVVILSHICASLSRGIEQFLVFGFSFLVTPLVRGTGIG